MDHERAFHEAIREQPDDDLHRLAWADWLEDHGQTDRAAFVRAQLRVASLSMEDLARDAAEDEADDLLAVHESQWAGRVSELALEWQWRRGCIEHVTVKVDALLNHGEELFALAPVRSIRLLSTAEDLAPLAGSPFLRQVEELDVSAEVPVGSFFGENLSDRALSVLLASPHLTGLKHLAARNQRIEGPLIRTLIDTGVLARLVSLDLSDNRALGDRAVRLLAGASAPHLERLGLLGTNATLGGMRSLAHAKGMPRWRELEFNTRILLGESALLSRLTSLNDLGSNFPLRNFSNLLASLRPNQVRRLSAAGTDFTEEHLSLLANSPSLVGLEALRLERASVRDGQAQILAKSANFTRLTSLDLSGCAIGGPGIRALVHSPHLPCLRELSLAGNYVGTTNTAVIAASPRASRLTSLDLARANLDAESARILAGAPAVSRLRVLRLGNRGPFQSLRDGDNHLGEEGVKALANSPHLRRLRELDLDSNEIDSSGAELLLRSPYLKRLKRLSLRNARLTMREREQLVHRFGPGVTF